VPRAVGGTSKTMWVFAKARISDCPCGPPDGTLGRLNLMQSNAAASVQL
jgi:hypothetical protein